MRGTGESFGLLLAIAILSRDRDKMSLACWAPTRVFSSSD
jgi:hypothetical protein